MAEYNTQRMFFFALLFLITLAFFWLIRGFLQPIFWAIALGIIVYPAHARLVPLLKNRASIAAVVSVVLVVLVVILPLIGIGAAVTSEATALCQRLTSEQDASVGEAAPSAEVDDVPSGARCKIDLQIEDVFAWAQGIPLVGNVIAWFDFDAQALEDQLSSIALAASETIASNALAIGQNTLRMARASPSSSSRSRHRSRCRRRRRVGWADSGGRCDPPSPSACRPRSRQARHYAPAPAPPRGVPAPAPR
jgi:predicted PurR-regulated permease PerM